MRLIDGDDLYQKVDDTIYTYSNTHGLGGYWLAEDALEDIEHAPTVEAEPVRHGKWEITKDDYYCVAKCSLCHEEWSFEVYDDIESLNYRYCPNCGSFNGGSNETLHN